MHVPMLDHHLQHKRIEILQMIVDPGSFRLSILRDFSDRWPVGRRIHRGISGRRIDSALKQRIERLVESRGTQTSARQNIPVEGLEMAEIEDQPVALRDRTRVERLGRNQAKQTVSLLARRRQFTTQGFDRVGDYRTRHGFSKSALSKAGLTDASNPVAFVETKKVVKTDRILLLG